MLRAKPAQRETVPLYWRISNHIYTTKHKLWVFWYILKVCKALIWRGLIHDLSKYSNREAASFQRWCQEIKGLKYGTPEYKRVSNSFAYDNWLHQSVNPHHPEYWGSIDEMSLLDKIEMLTDWKAASRRRVGATMEKSIEYNAQIFGYDEDFKQGLSRDAEEIGL